MDQKVLEAQQWVNSTYGAVPGYNRCPENGLTGWSTMYSLTRALQHELGITSLSDAFGPTTLSRLSATGAIGPDTTNQNIVNIVQHALFCKGYWGGPGDGIYGVDTASAVAEIKYNAGLDGSDTDVQPKIFKALLTMDAYVVLAGGTATIRSIQQWLNSRYFGRRDFFLVPCDGIFSRDVQKALFLAIQFELGMTDDQATGVFGPGTQAGLKNHQLAQGSSGIFVNIFTAAMVFNRFRLADDGSIYVNFTGTFSSSVATAVGDFQEFSALPKTSRGDFATWCQLLVSTGDPNRAGTAVDCITTITDARAKTLYGNGYRFVGRYLDEKSWGTLNKEIQPGELDTIFANGLKVFPISQYYGEEVAYFTYSQGFLDAADAHAAAVRYGFNTGTVIYFAVDYDATQDEIDSNILPYFRGVVAGLADRGKKYVHGVYASRNVCAQVTTHTYARWSFVSGMSAGFSGNMGFPLPENWSFNQIQTLWMGTGDGRIEVDKDIYKPKSDPAVSSVKDPISEVDTFVSYINTLLTWARDYGGNRPADQLVMEFLRHEDYNNAQWQLMIGGIDEGFKNHALERLRQSGSLMIRDFRDTFYGVDIKVSHLGASLNAAYLQAQPGGTLTNRGDVGGWGGDWMTFYGEWRRDSESYSSGLTYCREKLAKVDGNGTFKLRDLIEDADAYNLAKEIRNGTSIWAAMYGNYSGGGHLSRMKRFFEGRFGSASGAKAISRDMLLTTADPIISTGRAYLIQTTGGIPTIMPNVLPNSKLDEFCQGFADMLLDRVGQENARVAAFRAQGKI
ncbi:glycoside hydrolase domain-containing protein [Micromonospora sp. NPDC050980]|uniref:glycoside hydrolase domain-containing protein n=1 Tax=Micromonospora sp. NPDC050980 TaxID=3155161 RepID=UPI00340BC69F